MSDKINGNEETAGSMIERMMRGEFDGIEISEETPAEDPAQEAVSEEEENNEEDTNQPSGSVETDENIDDDNEDTKDIDTYGDESESGSETNETIDGESQENEDDSSETAGVADLANTLVESDNDSNSETKDQSDGKDQENEEPNYKEEYEKLLNESKTYKDYYDKVTSEFTANGVKVKGFKDPDKVIQAQQAMYGLEEKFSKLKKYRQFHAPLEKRGMITDQTKFDLAMNIMDGDVEAIKAHMKSLNIDPVDLDLDEVNYTGKTTISSNVELGLNDILEASEAAGIKQDVERVLYSDWDENSVVDLLSTEVSRNAFVEHMRPDADGNSLFKTVSHKAREMSVINPGFSDLSSIQKYNAALAELEKEYSTSNSQQQSREAPTSKPVVTHRVNDAIAEAKAAESKRIADAEAKAIEKYKLDMEAKNKAADEARKKAASLNVRKTAVNTVKKDVDPMKLEGESFMDYWKQLERAGL